MNTSRRRCVTQPIANKSEVGHIHSSSDTSLYFFGKFMKAMFNNRKLHLKSLSGSDKRKGREPSTQTVLKG